MKVQLFTISTEVEKTVYDQNSLNDFLSTVAFKKSSVHFVESEIPHWSVLVHYEEEQPLLDFKEIAAVNPDIKDFTYEQAQVFDLLKQWRNDKASELNFSAYMVAQNSELMNVVLQNPQSLSQLRKIKGFGELKTTKYGTEIIAILKQQQD